MRSKRKFLDPLSFPSGDTLWQEAISTGVRDFLDEAFGTQLGEDSDSPGRETPQRISILRNSPTPSSTT
jgi:hypothetical protein